MLPQMNNQWHAISHICQQPNISHTFWLELAEHMSTQYKNNAKQKGEF